MFARLTRITFVAALVVGAVACKGKSTSAPKLTDLSTSLDTARVAFNAHKQEARFLALLSPA